MVDVKNLTPHDIDLILIDGSHVRIPPSASPARIVFPKKTGPRLDATIGHIATTEQSAIGVTTDLPDPVDGVILIVSQLVAGQHPDRHDLYFPDLIQRDDQGAVIGCQALGRIAASEQPPPSGNRPGTEQHHN